MLPGYPDDEADEVKNVVISRKIIWVYQDLRPTYDQIRGARQKLHTTNGYHLLWGIAVVYCRVLELSIFGAFDEGEPYPAWPYTENPDMG